MINFNKNKYIFILTSGLVVFLNTYLSSVSGMDDMDVFLATGVDPVAQVTINAQAANNLGTSDSSSAAAIDSIGAVLGGDGTLMSRASSLKTRLGGTEDTAQARVDAISRALLRAPTGVMSTDLASVRGFLLFPSI